MKQYDYPDEIEIQPVTKPVNATIRVPGSKSITNRALVLGALASRTNENHITDALECDDTIIMIAALRQLGFSVSESQHNDVITIANSHPNRLVPSRKATLYLGNSGTSMRFLTAVLTAANGQYRLDGDDRMRQRPIGDLVAALRELGANVRCEFNNHCPPVLIEPSSSFGGQAKLRATVSSQFVSAILLIAPFANGTTELTLEGDLVSEPYVRMTCDMMKRNGLRIFQRPGYFKIEGNQSALVSIDVEADASSASYPFAAAAITNGHVAVPISLRMDTLAPIQGDFAFLELLRKMGCEVNNKVHQITFSVVGHKLRGITVDMNAISDTVMTLAAVACFAEGPTTIRNVAHIRQKECDRITALCTELRKLGVEVEEYPDGLKITPRPMHGAVIETYNDHRIAMSMALIGLKVPGVVIKNPGCVAKTYPGYWDDFQKLYE